jgi:predicted transcriptional regulator of viral defense system
MPGRIYRSLFDIAADQYGYLTVADARAAGIDPHRFVEMRKRGTLDRVAHGLYRLTGFPASSYDQLMEAALWPRPSRGVLSHETALDMHGLCDVNPAKIHITVPERYRASRETPALYVLHARALDPKDITAHEGIRVVTPYRAILDGIEAHMRASLIEQAIDIARRRGLLRPHELEQLKRASALTLVLPVG